MKSCQNIHTFYLKCTIATVIKTVFYCSVIPRPYSYSHMHNIYTCYIQYIWTSSHTCHNLTRYRDWPWFNTLIDLLEMILAKSEERIAENYDNQLVQDDESKLLGSELREKLKKTREMIVIITGLIV